MQNILKIIPAIRVCRRTTIACDLKVIANRNDRMVILAVRANAIEQNLSAFLGFAVNRPIPVFRHLETSLLVSQFKSHRCSNSYLIISCIHLWTYRSVKVPRHDIDISDINYLYRRCPHVDNAVLILERAVDAKEFPSRHREAVPFI